MSDVSEQTGTAWGYSTDGGREVLYEETLSLKDEAGARNLIRFTRVAVLFLLVSTLASVVLVAVMAADMFVSAAGSVDVALSILEDLRSDRPRAFGVIVLFGMLVIGYGSFSIAGFLLQMRRAFDKQIHVRVTDWGVTVQRVGSRYWQSSGVEIPFEAVTSVEYLDPDQSSLRVEVGDLRASRFFAGRKQNWIRIERANDTAVYVGSDRPAELAEIIARRAPGVDAAEPY